MNTHINRHSTAKIVAGQLILITQGAALGLNILFPKNINIEFHINSNCRDLWES